MKLFASMFFASGVACGFTTTSIAAVFDSNGLKIIEIDQAGNVRTTEGTGSGAIPAQHKTRETSTAVVPRETYERMSICDSRYRWLPQGLSNDTVVRTRAFYRDVTKKYELAQTNARKLGTKPSQDRENEYWNAYGKLVDSVPRSERRIVERGISPRLSWWCSAMPVIAKPVLPPTAPR